MGPALGETGEAPSGTPENFGFIILLEARLRPARHPAPHGDGHGLISTPSLPVDTVAAEETTDMSRVGSESRCTSDATSRWLSTLRPTPRRKSSRLFYESRVTDRATYDRRGRHQHGRPVRPRRLLTDGASKYPGERWRRSLRGRPAAGQPTRGEVVGRRAHTRSRTA